MARIKMARATASDSDVISTAEDSGEEKPTVSEEGESTNPLADGLRAMTDLTKHVWRKNPKQYV